MGGRIQARAEMAAKASPRVPALNGIRAYAILAVVLLHLLGASGVLAATTGTSEGVLIWSVLGNSIDAFFIISGFVLFLPCVVRGGEFGGRVRFWIGRATRLLPAFWLVIGISLIAIAIKPPIDGLGFPSALDIGSHLALLQMPMTLVDSHLAIGFGINGPLWLISVVVCFYAVLPFIAPGWARHPLIALTIAAAITVGWKLSIDHSPWMFAELSGRTLEESRLLAVDQAPGWAYSFGLGMTGAWAYVRLRERFPAPALARHSLQWALPVIAFYAFAAWLYGRNAFDVPGNVGQIARSETLTSFLNTTSRAALIGVVITGPLWLQRPFANPITDRLADLSYGVYLVHWLIVIYAAAFLGLPTDGSLVAVLTWIAVVLPASLVFAALSRRWVELPIQRWVKRRTTASMLGPAPEPTPART